MAEAERANNEKLRRDGWRVETARRLRELTPEARDGIRVALEQIHAGDEIPASDWFRVQLEQNPDPIRGALSRFEAVLSEVGG